MAGFLITVDRQEGAILPQTCLLRSSILEVYTDLPLGHTMAH